ncbi:MAG: DUF2865 domain-containing protein [Pseudomonadota bacterium]
MRRHKRAKSWKLARAIGIAAALMLPSHAVYAASCSALKSELRKLESGSGNQSAASRKWSKAKRQQEKAIAAAARDARHFGCAQNRTAKCKDLNGKLKRMNSNLAAIERQLKRSGGGGAAKNTKRIRQVRASLDRQGCNAPARDRQANARANSDQPKAKSFFSRLFNAGPQVEQTAARTGDREISAVRRAQRSEASRPRLPSGGVFRTLCVRTCDGYFFPVSFSTDKSQFVNDAARCTEICPAAPTELYVYRNPGGDQSQMMSLAGIPYAEQPFAFRYKSEFVEGCSCRQTGKSKSKSAWSEVSVSSGGRLFFSDISSGLPNRALQPSQGDTFKEADKAPALLSRPPLSASQLPRYEDPGTLFNLEKGFDVTRVAAFISTDKLPSTEAGAGRTSSAEDGFPLLSLRKQNEEDEIEAVSVSPVFKSDDQGFRPMPESSAPVRVVGPDYFVAQ